MKEQRDPQADAEVALAILQDAMERMMEFMTPVEAIEHVTQFGIVSALHLVGYEGMREMIMRAATDGLRGQLAARLMGPS